MQGMFDFGCRAERAEKAELCEGSIHGMSVFERPLLAQSGPCAAVTFQSHCSLPCVDAFGGTQGPERIRSPSKRARPTHIAGWTQPRSLLFLACYPAAALISCGEAVRPGRRPSSPCFLSGGSPAYWRNASAISVRLLTPVITTSTMVKEAWK